MVSNKCSRGLKCCLFFLRDNLLLIVPTSNEAIESMVVSGSLNRW